MHFCHTQLIRYAGNSPRAATTRWPSRFNKCLGHVSQTLRKNDLVRLEFSTAFNAFRAITFQGFDSSYKLLSSWSYRICNTGKMAYVGYNWVTIYNDCSCFRITLQSLRKLGHRKAFHDKSIFAAHLSFSSYQLCKRSTIFKTPETVEEPINNLYHNPRMVIVYRTYSKFDSRLIVTDTVLQKMLLWNG